MIVVGKGSHRLGESPFPELEKPTMGSLPLVRRGSTPQIQQLDRSWNVA